jgi:hypothetical protein
MSRKKRRIETKLNFHTRMTMEVMTSSAANAAIYVESTRAAGVLHARIAACSEVLTGAGSQVGSRRSPCPAPQPRILPLGSSEMNNLNFQRQTTCVRQHAPLYRLQHCSKRRRTRGKQLLLPRAIRWNAPSPCHARRDLTRSDPSDATNTRSTMCIQRSKATFWFVRRQKASDPGCHHGGLPIPVEEPCAHHREPFSEGPVCQRAKERKCTKSSQA